MRSCSLNCTEKRYVSLLGNMLVLEYSLLMTLIDFSTESTDGHGKAIVLAHVLAAASVGLISAAAAAVHYRRRNPKKELLSKDQVIVPQLRRNESSGRVGRLERFSVYVGTLFCRSFAFKSSLSSFRRMGISPENVLNLRFIRSVLLMFLFFKYLLFVKRDKSFSHNT